ncbi:SemiSWEET transporter [Mucilaginibacter calamicampi]|uniref:SemiSWEET transporter n=1 Tax=Mucilaginibacter calamicampi TaxID=1302352 RepID=A0ABW2YUS6_9SPHI
MNYIDIIGLVAALCTSISFLPQAIKTIRTRDTSAISLSMYCVFTGGTVLWLIYGIMIISYPVIIANTITLILAGIILAYKVRYK